LTLEKQLKAGATGEECNDLVARLSAHMASVTDALKDWDQFLPA